MGLRRKEEELTRYHSLKIILRPTDIILQRLGHKGVSITSQIRPFASQPPTYIVEARLPVLQSIYQRHDDTRPLERRDL